MIIKNILEIFTIKNYIGNINIQIDGVNLCNRQTLKNNIISYAVNDKYKESIANNKAIKCLIICNNDIDEYKDIILERNGIIIPTQKPESLFYQIYQYLSNKTDLYEKYDFKPTIGFGCNIHPSAIIYNGVIIGDDVTINANSVIKPGTTIGNSVAIGCNTTIGSEGFQIIKVDGIPYHIKHSGKTKICDNAYIGDNTDICNSLFEGETYIGENAKIDNLVHIAHNCYIGDNSVVTAGTILCGSSILENGAWIGVNSSILNRVVIGENALIGIGSVVTRNIDANAIAYGVPAKQKS